MLTLVAIQWGWMRSQIANLSRRLDQHDDTRERLARIEAKLDYITPKH
jgi:cyanophycinase-like exopeptidase